MASKRAMLRSTPGSSSTTATFEPPLASAASSVALPFGLGTSSAMRKAAPCGCVMDMTRLRDVIFHNYGEVSSVKPWSSLFSYGTLYAGRAPHDEPRCPGPQSRLKDPTMPSAKQHYDELLADVYSWMLGGFDSGIERNLAFFRKRGIAPTGSATAFDLGAGCGFQSIPLARLGFAVTAIDFDSKLLAELAAGKGPLPIRMIEDDLLSFDRYADGPIELIVCMTDTLLHLESEGDVRRLFGKAYRALEKDGRFMLTFRDLTKELTDL